MTPIPNKNILDQILPIEKPKKQLSEIDINRLIDEELKRRKYFNFTKLIIFFIIWDIINRIILAIFY